MGYKAISETGRSVRLLEGRAVIQSKIKEARTKGNDRHLIAPCSLHLSLTHSYSASFAYPLGTLFKAALYTNFLICCSSHDPVGQIDSIITSSLQT